ncbi:hypothetical protein QZH41_013818, partial [Actinostola sp. cb2023]
TKLFPTIHVYWKRCQKKVLDGLKVIEGGIVVAGDERHDSMGHSAKYGAYTILCCSVPMIIHFALVQRNQVGNSPAMEFESFKQSMEYLIGYGILINTFISDRHVSIASHMKKVVTNIVHYFDIWHLKKSSEVYDRVCKVLTTDSLKRGIKQASPWAQTSCWEGFHSLLNQFAPKMIAYSYAGMYCRHILAAVHINFNLQREIKTREADHQSRQKIVFPKFKNGEATIRDVRVKADFS